MLSHIHCCIAKPEVKPHPHLAACVASCLASSCIASCSPRREHLNLKRVAKVSLVLERELVLKPASTLNADQARADAALNQLPSYFNGSGNATYGRLTFCAGSTAEREFCSRAARLFNASESGFGWSCRRPLNTSADCAADVAAGHTDAVVSSFASGFLGFYHLNDQCLGFQS